MQSKSLLVLLSPRTPSGALKVFLAIACLSMWASSVASIIGPLWKYRDYSWYYAKVYWPEFVVPMCVAFLAAGLWNLRNWARLLLMAGCWLIAITALPESIFGAMDVGEPALWDSTATLIANLETSPAVRACAVTVVSLLVIHLLQIRRADFR